MKKGILAVLCTILGTTIGITFGKLQSITSENILEVKLRSYYDTLSGWLKLKQLRRSIEEYLLKEGYQEIAIYAMGEMGNLLFDELENSDVKVKYAIDQDKDISHSKVKVMTMDDTLEKVDAVIVSIGFAHEDVKRALMDRIDCPVLSLQDIVYEICMEDNYELKK